MYPILVIGARAKLKKNKADFEKAKPLLDRAYNEN